MERKRSVLEILNDVVSHPVLEFGSLIVCYEIEIYYKDAIILRADLYMDGRTKAVRIVDAVKHVNLHASSLF